jgi:3-hydroxybutyryl-CoA dehydrogenase
MDDTVQHLVVVGGGVMGNGIAQTVALASIDVTLVDISEAALSRARDRIAGNLERSVAGNRVTEEAAADALARIAGSTDLESTAATADYVIETITEDLSAKQGLLRRLDAVCRPEVVFASNTSQFSITLLAAATGRPGRVIGTHWFNPPPVMRLVEVVRGLETSDETLALTKELLARCGKEVIVCLKDSQGFVTSRLIMVLALEAARILEEGVADVEDINRACVLAFNHAMGPLDTFDLSGLDTILRVADVLTEHFGERFRAPQNLRTLVNAGHLGRKSGRGYSAYADGS